MPCLSVKPYSHNINFKRSNESDSYITKTTKSHPITLPLGGSIAGYGAGAALGYALPIGADSFVEYSIYNQSDHYVDSARKHSALYKKFFGSETPAKEFTEELRTDAAKIGLKIQENSTLEDFGKLLIKKTDDNLREFRIRMPQEGFETVMHDFPMEEMYDSGKKMVQTNADLQLKKLQTDARMRFEAYQSGRTGAPTEGMQKILKAVRWHNLKTLSLILGTSLLLGLSAYSYILHRNKSDKPAAKV